MALTSLRNGDLSDRELLHVCADVAHSDGVFFAFDVADRLGIKTNGKRSPAGTVSTRLSWMRRYGFVDRIDPKSLDERARFDGLKRPGFVTTPEGEAVMSGRLPASVVKELEKGNVGTNLLMLREVARRSYVQGSFSQAAAIRREWQHTSGRRG